MLSQATGHSLAIVLIQIKRPLAGTSGDVAEAATASFDFRHRGSVLPQSQERAPVAAIPGLLPAYEAARKSRRVAFLTLHVIAPSSEIEPDDRVLGTMALRLGLIAERRKSLCNRALWRT